MHDELIRYNLDGEIMDSNIPQQKERLVWFLENQMRDDGCVPSLDMDPHFTLSFRPSDEVYDFTLSVYGIFVGKEDAWTTAGMMSGKTITKYTPPIKSKGS